MHPSIVRVAIVGLALATACSRDLPSTGDAAPADAAPSSADGALRDAAPSTDAGVLRDAALSPDAGVLPDDASPTDDATPRDAAPSTGDAALPVEAGVCAGAQVWCAGACVTLADDPANCGTCGHSCATGQACGGGTCGWLCAVGETTCASGCADLATDGANCGACGHGCGGAPCVGGVCQSGGCGAGLTACGGTCVDTQNDPDNCGGCGVSCHGQPCAGGQCGRWAFATGALYDGDLGGLTGADAKCQSAAAAASLPGIYRAWLSSTTSNAADRLTHFAGPYVLPDHSLLANGWAQLALSSHPHAFDVTESGFALSAGDLAWTASYADGTYVASDSGDCVGWTYGSGSSCGSYSCTTVGGKVDATGMEWTIAALGFGCWNNRMHLYCLGQ